MPKKNSKGVKEDQGATEVFQGTAKPAEPSAGPAQKPLFGESDMVLNTLETELAEVRGEIEKCTKAQERLLERDNELQDREKNLRDAIAVMRKSAKKATAS